MLFFASPTTTTVSQAATMKIKFSPRKCPVESQTNDDSKPMCVPLNEVPGWLQHNDYLLTGHRPPLHSFRRCIRSIFHVHNETGNIWSHLLGSLVFAFLQVYFYVNAPPSMTAKDLLIFTCFFSSAVICLALSAVYHTFYCHSEHVGNIVKRLDYCGITLLIVGSFMPWLYYGFYCDFYTKRVYMAMIFGLGLLTMAVSLCEKFSEPDLRGLRAGVFIVFGLSGLLPSTHWVYAYGNPFYVHPQLQLSIACLGLMSITYISGAMFYALRVPERFMPGRVDYWFHSHQIFHVFVIIAALIQYFGTTHMALYRLSHNAICPVNEGADLLLPKNLPVSLPVNPFLGDPMKLAMITPHPAMSL